MSELPLQEEHLREVHDAVNSSSSNGYDEEYTMSSLFSAPGSGVGDDKAGTKAVSYLRPLKDLFSEYFASNGAGTKGGAADVERYISALSDSDMQIYWPYSEDWDGETFPLVTFDPGYGAESNYAYVLSYAGGEASVVDSVLVTEDVARERPVWVINRNDDSAFTPLELFSTKAADMKVAASDDTKGPMLSIKTFKMLRNYDSWFGGASEFFVKCGAVDGFKASSDSDLKLYTPSVTDFMISVKRSQCGLSVPFQAIMLTDMTDQMDKVAFLIIEDDGGTRTSWKCEATVKYKSKTYGFDLEIPYNEKDDIVWRGQLSTSFFGEKGDTVSGRFGDVEVTFELQ